LVCRNPADPLIQPNTSSIIEVYPLRVTLETKKWREKDERQRAWFRQDEAAELVDEGGLAQIIDEWR
jgi:hypothetical protein